LELDGGGAIQAARIAAGSAIPFPKRLVDVEQTLIGREPTQAVFQEAAKQADKAAPWRGREGMSADYSRHLAEVSILDVLERAANFARERAE
ncbi:MAG: hypothetical protein LBN38_03495, partial [Verrucomicrobiota bacterium]|nr:hypothetical protein [Verrucomicrobiota bacterium]